MKQQCNGDEVAVSFDVPPRYFKINGAELVGYAGFTSYQARLAVEYPKERGIVMAWNNTALYIGISIGSVLGGYVITNWGYSLLPYVGSVVAIIGFVLSNQKVKELEKESVFSQEKRFDYRS